MSAKDALQCALEAVAEKVTRLEKENASMRDNGRMEGYIRDLQALTQLAVDVGIPDAESTGHSTLVFQLREKLRANQEAADVLRLIEAGRMEVEPHENGVAWYVRIRTGNRAGSGGGKATLSECVRSVAQHGGITLPAKEEKASVDADDVRASAEAMAEPGGGEYIDLAKELEVPPEPAAESGEAKYRLHYFESDGVQKWRMLDANGMPVFCGLSFGQNGWPESVLSLLNGTSPVHQQLAADEKTLNDASVILKGQAAELSDLRRDREAWDAVKAWGIRLDQTIAARWIAMWGFNEDAEPLKHSRAADPREAVLALKAQLEGGK